jgi:hypothetical protein
MKLNWLAGLLAPALLSVAAASQTVVVRPLPFTGVPRILPHPVTSLPLGPARLPAPLALPLARLEAASLAPLPVLVAPAALSAPAALPAVRMEAGSELHPSLRALLGFSVRLEEKPAPAAAPAKPSREGAVLFDGESLTLPEDDLEAELGLR